uniref:Uncharacterized protein n=1 Tax=Catagonus wagneri TaxID=51154 RepID=A0A8C3WUF6_9CETA
KPFQNLLIIIRTVTRGDGFKEPSQRSSGNAVAALGLKGVPKDLTLEKGPEGERGPQVPVTTLGMKVGWLLSSGDTPRAVPLTPPGRPAPG